MLSLQVQCVVTVDLVCNHFFLMLSDWLDNMNIGKQNQAAQEGLQQQQLVAKALEIKLARQETPNSCYNAAATKSHHVTGCGSCHHATGQLGPVDGALPCGGRARLGKDTKHGQRPLAQRDI